jgi:hypothetical protein
MASLFNWWVLINFATSFCCDRKLASMDGARCKTCYEVEWREIRPSLSIAIQIVHHPILFCIILSSYSSLWERASSTLSPPPRLHVVYCGELIVRWWGADMGAYADPELRCSARAANLRSDRMGGRRRKREARTSKHEVWGKVTLVLCRCSGDSESKISHTMYVHGPVVGRKER